AGRDRRRARRPARRGGLRGGRARRRRRRAPARRVRGRRARRRTRPRGARHGAATQSARLHGARDVRRPVVAAADDERQGRPRGAARPRRVEHAARRRARRAAHGGRDRAGRDPVRAARRRGRQRGGQLLPPRRPLAARHAAHRARARRVRRRALAAHPLRRADHRRSRCRDRARAPRGGGVMSAEAPTASRGVDPNLSLYRLLDPEVLANPYPLYHRLRTEDPVHWDPFLHAWVVTRYADVVTVLHRFSANRTPTPEQLAALGLETLTPVARVMVRQMLFLDAPSHTRIRGLASQAFTPRRVERLREHIQDIMDGLLDAVLPQGRMDVIEDLAALLPAIVTAEMLGVPTRDHQLLKKWSADFAEVLGNFQHNPDRAAGVLRSTEEMGAYFRAAVRV